MAGFIFLLFCYQFMKKNIKLSDILSFLFSISLVFVLSACGVSGGGGGGGSSSSGSGGSSSGSVTSPNCDDPANNLYRFTTLDSSYYNQPTGNVYRGTAVYYKIYSDRSACTSQASSIVAAGSGGKNTLDGFGFKQLGGNEITVSPSSSNQNVTIRLFKETSYNATGHKRYNGSSDFQFTSTYYPGKAGDSNGDFYGTPNSAGPWYVAAFAFAVVNSNGSNSYNEPRYLGMLKIY